MRSGTLTLLMMDMAERKKLLAFMPGTVGQATEFLRSTAEQLCDRYGGFLWSHLSAESSMVVIFEFPSAAVEMASELYRALRSQSWYPSRPICRSAIVTGEVVCDGETLKGDVIDTLAAILELARPGQVLIGEGTHFLARHSLKGGNGFMSLGFNHVEDRQRGQTLYQLLHPDLPYDFQPLVSMLTAGSNLPRGTTPFIGRRNEIEAIREGFYHAKVVSLIGFDGVGKTRLATEVAFEMLEDHYHGACYVDLANAESESQIYSEVAVALGVRAYQNDSTGAAVIDRLRDSEMLLVLDNIHGTRQNGVRVITRIMDMCPRIQILNTSNRFVPLPFMHAYPVHPMSTPAAGSYSSPEELSEYDSVSLFINRVTMMDERFALSRENANTVAAVCRKLDGIPLAIELAAAKVGELDLSILARRLEDRFEVLGRGKGGRTKLEACIRFSFEWLSSAEQKLLTRLVVFSGEFTLQAAQAVAVWDPLQEDEIAPILAQLAMQGFVRKSVRDNILYIEILDTIRDFCRPFAIEEINQLMDRHAEWYAGNAPALIELLNGPREAEVVSRIDLTYNNYILALNWLLDAPDDHRTAAILALLHRYWLSRCLYSEGYHWSETILHQKPDLSSELRGRMHIIAGVLGGLCGAFEKAGKHFREAESIGKKGHFPDVLLAAYRASGDNLLYVGNAAAAVVALRKSLDIALGLDNEWEIAESSLALANVLTDIGNHDEARSLAIRSLEICKKLDRPNKEAWSRFCLGRSFRMQGQEDEAIEQLDRSFHLHRETADNRGVVEGLREHVLLRIRAASYHSAAAILGAAESFRKARQVPVASNRRVELEKAMQTLKQELGDHYQSEFEKGAQMTPAEVEEFLLLNTK